MRKLLWCLVTAVVAAGCSNGPVEAPERFELVGRDAAQLEATYSEGGATVRMLAAEVQANVVEVTYDFGSSIVAFRLDYTRGTGRFMPDGSPLDASHQRLVNGLLGGLEGVVPAEGRSRLEEAAMRQTSFMQIVPLGEPLTAYEFVSERGWTHISCSCGTQNIGGYYRQAGRGCGCNGGSGNGCKGRCGQGCGITSTPSCVGSTAYTRDCAKHDYGLGSFSAASDDYSFASNNCSCSGVGTCY
jgi:hypothetical protein